MYHLSIRYVNVLQIKHRRESELILAELQVLKRVRGNSKGTPSLPSFWAFLI